MSCERYQRLLHLNRSGEISRQEADELRRHLRLCERCTLELQRIERADGFLDHLAAFSPVPKNPEQLTADILRRVRAESVAPHTVSLVESVLDFFAVPSVRYSAVTLVVVVTMTFMSQLFTLLNDIADLEQRMTSPIQNVTAEATYTVQSKTLQEIATSIKGKSVNENFPLNVGADRLDIPAKDVETFLSTFDMRRLPAMLGAAAMRIDNKTFEKILNEVKATAELTFRVRHEGA